MSENPETQSKTRKFGILIRGLDPLMWRRFRGACALSGISATGRLRELIAEEVKREERENDWS